MKQQSNNKERVLQAIQKAYNDKQLFKKMAQEGKSIKEMEEAGLKFLNTGSEPDSEAKLRGELQTINSEINELATKRLVISSKLEAIENKKEEEKRIQEAKKRKHPFNNKWLEIIDKHNWETESNFYCIRCYETDDCYFLTGIDIWNDGVRCGFVKNFDAHSDFGYSKEEYEVKVAKKKDGTALLKDFEEEITQIKRIIADKEVPFWEDQFYEHKKGFEKK